MVNICLVCAYGKKIEMSLSMFERISVEERCLRKMLILGERVDSKVNVMTPGERDDPR